jgi:hypothetical protein
MAMDADLRISQNRTASRHAVARTRALQWEQIGQRELGLLFWSYFAAAVGWVIALALQTL